MRTSLLLYIIALMVMVGVTSPSLAQSRQQPNWPLADLIPSGKQGDTQLKMQLGNPPRVQRAQSTTQPRMQPYNPRANQPVVQQRPMQQADTYRLGAGDRLRVTVFNEPDLSGEFEVDGNGAISLPLIGEVAAGKLSLRELERVLEAYYRDGYLLYPRVSIEVMNFRHFFIMGEVNKPGSYPYSSGLTVLNAVALAGGFTYRAKENDIIIHRSDPYNPKNTRKIKAGKHTKVLPGDTLHIDERFF